MGGDTRIAHADHCMLAADATDGAATAAGIALGARLIWIVEIRAARPLQEIASRCRPVTQLTRGPSEQCT